MASSFNCNGTFIQLEGRWHSYKKVVVHSLHFSFFILNTPIFPSISCYCRCPDFLLFVNVFFCVVITVLIKVNRLFSRRFRWYADLTCILISQMTLRVFRSPRCARKICGIKSSKAESAGQRFYNLRICEICERKLSHSSLTILSTNITTQKCFSTVRSSATIRNLAYHNQRWSEGQELRSTEVRKYRSSEYQSLP